MPAVREATKGTTSTASWVVPIPPAAQVGDMILITLIYGDATLLVNVFPIGWGLAETNLINDDFQLLFWKQKTASDGPNVTFGMSASRSGSYMSVAYSDSNGSINSFKRTQIDGSGSSDLWPIDPQDSSTFNSLQVCNVMSSQARANAVIAGFTQDVNYLGQSGTFPTGQSFSRLVAKGDTPAAVVDWPTSNFGGATQTVVLAPAGVVPDPIIVGWSEFTNSLGSVLVKTAPGALEGDWMLMWVTHRGTVTPPATGWTTIADIAVDAATFRMTIFAKVAGATTPVSETWTLSSGTNSIFSQQIYRFVDLTVPLIIATIPQAPNFTGPAVTLPTIRGGVISGISGATISGGTPNYQPPAGYLELSDLLSSTSSLQATALIKQLPSGSSGTIPWTNVGSGTTSGKASITIGLPHLFAPLEGANPLLFCSN